VLAGHHHGESGRGVETCVNGLDATLNSRAWCCVAIYHIPLRYQSRCGSGSGISSRRWYRRRRGVYHKLIFLVLQSPGVCWRVETHNAIVNCMIRLACGEMGYRGLGGLNERLGQSGPRRR
jgi:hypothetical protein